jgi:hypothetical protein
MTAIFGTSSKMPLRINNFLSWITPRIIHINDAGTWRSIRNIYVNDAGVWRRVFQRGLTATMVAGTDGGFNTGYSSGSFGSMSAVTLHDGRIVNQLSHNSFGGTAGLSITGFSADPGVGYLQSLTITGYGTLTPSDGSFFAYSYAASTAQWSWVDSAFVNGFSYPLEIVTS